MKTDDFSRVSIDMIATGQRIKEARISAGISIRELQRMLGFETPVAIYYWQAGKRLPSLDHLVILSLVLSVPIGDLLVLIRPE